MPRKIPVLLIVVLALLGGAFVALRQQNVPEETIIDPDIPYIYYYAHFLDGFVIERVDGSASRLVNADLPPGDNQIVDMVWSPSGRYVALHTRRFSIGDELDAVLVASIDENDGGAHLLLNDIRLRDMAWSPTEDLLLVEYNYEDADEAYYGGYDVFDAQTGDVVLSWQALGTSNLPRETWWAADGGTIYRRGSVYNPARRYVPSARFGYRPRPSLFVTQTRDGTVTERLFVVHHFMHVSEQRLTYMRIVDSGQRYELVIEDVATGEIWVIAAYTQELGTDYTSENLTYEIMWSPDSSQALLQTRQRNTLTLVEQQLLHWDTRTMVTIPNNVLLGDFRSANYAVLWLPDDQGILVEDDAVLSHVNLGTLERHVLSDTFSHNNWFEDPWYSVWLQSDNSVLFYDTREYLQIGDYDDDAIMRYDIATGTVETYAVISPDTLSWNYELGFEVVLLSPDAQYLTRKRSQQHVIQNISGEDIRLTPHSLARGQLLDVVWHTDAAWFIAEYNLNGFSDCCWDVGMVLHNIDGTGRRELSECLGDCYGFVPAHVVAALSTMDDGQATSIVPQPVHELWHEAPVLDFAWSPDGTQLATLTNPYYYSSSQNDANIHIWSLTTSPPEIIESYPHPDSDGCSWACQLTWTAEGGIETFVPADTSIYNRAYDPVPLRNSDGDLQVPDTWAYTLTEHGDYSYTFRDRASSRVLASIPAGDAPLSFRVLDAESGVLRWARDETSYIWDTQTIHGIPFVHGGIADYHAANNQAFFVTQWAIYPNFIWDFDTQQRIEVTSIASEIARFNPQGTLIAMVNRNYAPERFAPVVTIWEIPQ